MVLRNLRWMAACLVALAAIGLSPARSNAEIQILVEELTAGGAGTVGTPVFFSGSPSGSIPFSQSFSYTGSQFAVFNSGAITNSHLGTFTASLSANFGIAVLVDNPTNILRITVTDDGFNAPSGLAATLRNTASVSIATDGAAQVDSFSRLLTSPLTIPASSNTQLADGTQVGNPTAVATDVRPDTLGVSPITSSPIDLLPTKYALQQVIIISIPEDVSTPANTSFNGTAGVTATPAPAPGGLVLALAALPLIGLRRALRKSAA